MKEISLPRLYLLRSLYLLVVVGLSLVVWPGIFRHSQSWETMEGVVQCMLGAFSLVCLLGLRYPLQMLPMLMWELLWKVMWTLVVAYPVWSAGTMSAATANIAIMVVVVAIFPFAIPWDYVYANYVKWAGERWR